MKKLFEESKTIKHLTDAWKRVVDIVNDFATALQQENITLTSEILVGFVNQGAVYLSGQIVEAAVSQFQAAGINAGTAVRTGIESDAYRIAQGFDKFLSPIKTALNDAGIGPNVVQIKSGKAQFSQKDEKEIQERFSYYLREDQEALYSAIQAFCDKYNELATHMEQAGFIPLPDNLQAIYTQGSLSPIQHGIGTSELRADTYIYETEGELLPNPAWFNRSVKLEYLYKTETE